MGFGAQKLKSKYSKTICKPVVTLIGVGQAKMGSVFLHKGAGSKCMHCEFYNVCVKNLEAGRVYKVVNVRRKLMTCGAYETEMRVVEVADAEVAAFLPSKQAIEKAVITYSPVDCENQECENLELCVSSGLKSGDRCVVLEVAEGFECSQGLALKRVVLQRVPPS